ncbi:elongation factor G [Evansella halocellulosilytica]|uniref:elongation factor G n=1 Tax=Evansella halocellulosilytica TaxID=2011013 RepID=UPI000BB6E6D4|nr:TetM/TetW/TetO/TetS family tetracycline resistance ribosomal protection protein [Evansella halocellulosilytica]
MKRINIGVLAHVDAGKTTLTEQILYQAGIIKHVGSVDKGTTLTDSLEIERRRGITVKSAAVSFYLNDLKVNVIDTPGHADFISEVEHSLNVLDGAILVISAVEGVQSQTRVLMQTLKEHRIPTILFMNKIDRIGADYKKIVTMIQTLLDEHICEMNNVIDAGSSSVRIKRADPEESQWLDILALKNDSLLYDLVHSIPITKDQLNDELCRQTKSGNVYPLFAGSAMKGIGVEQLLASLDDFFPVHNTTESEAKPLSGIVFKVQINPIGERVTFIRLFEGMIQVREEIPVISKEQHSSLKVKHLYSLQNGKWVSVNEVGAGDIAILKGGHLKVGDVIGTFSQKMNVIHFESPPIQVIVSAKYREDEQILHNALHNLTAEDPFLQYRYDSLTKENMIHVFGKVQQEILTETIKQQYGIEALCSSPKVMCIEKPISTGEAVEYIGDSNNPFLATVGFRIEYNTQGSGLKYVLEAELGSLLLSFQKAIKETVEDVLQEGLYGWQVTDIVVTLTHTGYDSVLTTASDFRNLVPLVLMDALSKAETNVYEPANRIQLILPESHLSKVLSRATVLEGIFQEAYYQRKTVHLNGTMPVRTVDILRSELHSLTSGEGTISIRPGGYMIIKENFPKNIRRQLNPLNRGEYLLHINKIM